MLLSKSTVLIVYILVAIAASLHLIYLNTHSDLRHSYYTTYNNYIIFKQSFFHLIQGKDLYIEHLKDQWDLYKYSPTFALLFAPFSYLPDYIGLSLWNLLNALILFFAIQSLPLKDRSKNMLLWFVLLELLTSMQNTQSNALICGLIITAYSCLEHKRLFIAAMCISLAAFIKVYGGIAFILFLFYPDKVKFVLYSIFWMVLLAILPLLVLSPTALWAQYGSWLHMMQWDQSNSYGWSVMGWLHTWFGLNNIKNQVMLAGLALFFLPLLRTGMYRYNLYRILFLATMLVWVIIFNHKAESPTYIIAVTGVGIWYFAQKRNAIRTALLWFVLVFTCLSHTDLFPPAVRTQIVYPYFIKAFPCIVVWCIMMTEMILMRKSFRTSELYERRFAS